MLKRIKAWGMTAYMWIRSFRPIKKATILSAEETVNKVISEHISLVRFGDGEFFLIDGNNIHYQIYSSLLAQYLDEIVVTYNRGISGKYLLCMPKYYFECTGFGILKNRLLIRSWVRPRYLYKKKYDANTIFGDAFLFQKENESIYSKIWNRDAIKHVIFVHNNYRYAKEFSKKYCKEVTYIAIPSKNAFDVRYNILEEIIEKADNADVVLISAGPCSKYLIVKLAERGIWAIDTGHCWDEPLEII